MQTGSSTLDEQCSFQTKEEFLCLDARPVADETVVASDDPMTRDHDWQWVGPVRASHGLECTGYADPFREVLVRNRCPITNPAKLRPDFPLKISSDWIEPAMEFHKSAIEVPVQFIDDLFVPRQYFCDLDAIAVFLNPVKELLLSLCRDADLADSAI